MSCSRKAPANDIRPVANSSFLEENPAASALLKEVKIPLDAIFAQNARMNAGEGDPENVQRHASEWIEANGQLVDGWLSAAREAAK